MFWRSLHSSRALFWLSLALLALLACNLTSSAEIATSTRSATVPFSVTPPPPTATRTPTALATASPAPTATANRPVHRLAIRDGAAGPEFFDRQSGQPFQPRGVNYVFVPAGTGYSNLPLKVGIYDPLRTRSDFLTLAQYGYNTVRVFLDQCNAGPGCIGAADNDGLNPAYLDNIADMLLAAREADIFILFTSNDLPDQGGYAEEANAASGASFAGYRNSYYLTPGAVSATRRYWRDLLQGLAARQAALEMVFAWQLVNEQWLFQDQPPLSLTEGVVASTTGRYDMSDPAQKQALVADGLIHYIAEMRAEIHSHDPDALITMGFFAPAIAVPEWYVDTAPLLAGAPLDFFDFHAYPGERPLADYVDAFGMAGYAEKPIILGEYGAFRHIYTELPTAARAVSQWQADACQAGFTGWLYWTYYPAGANIGDRTWGFTDEANYLLELLAPRHQPDPCIAPEIVSANLAFQKPVTSSAALPQEPATSAVDENSATQWGSGGDAPQWLEVDLGALYAITEIRLLVGQWPAGETSHRLLVRSTEGDYVEIHRFTGPTSEGDWLVYTPAEPIPAVQYLRVETLASPSWVAWKELQVFGDGE